MLRSLSSAGGSAVSKLSGKSIDRFSGPAITYDDEQEAYHAIQAGEVFEGMVIVLRYQGPAGAPGLAPLALSLLLTLSHHMS